MPHSRYTEVSAEDILRNGALQLLAISEEAGPAIAATRDARQVFVTGHFEYDRMTLAAEYRRDKRPGTVPCRSAALFPRR